MLPRTATMHSSMLLGGALLCTFLLRSGTAGAEMLDTESEEELSPRALRDFYPKGPNLTSEKQLLGALQEVLEKLQAKRLPIWEKKFGQVPTCDIGEQCAMRKGARIGKLCDCPRGAFCNFYLLKCL
ncbi:cocaine- and amphetamine-regulated transcript protein-like [Thalassophryne amazonica]|uniref:cocaine- and amphetamine-regulated transcript protein-like n=1 Tax=Thalassophryne amazonica TaxID=390379 RepID=UPI0014726B4E|nr:cocaine- and amphetamine-regulated transcript protein-like [Thalassophryne amazonica]